MGPPEDFYGRPLLVNVNLRSAESFAIFTGGSQNAIIVDGTKMTEPETPRYWITVETTFIDIYGSEQFFKRDLNLVVVNINFPLIVQSDPLIFIREDVDFVLSSDLQAADEEDKRVGRPKPAFNGMAEDGAIRIKWDSPLVNLDADILSSRKVILPFAQSASGEPTAFLTDRTNSMGFEKVTVRDAIQVNLVPEYDNGVSPNLLSSQLEVVDQETMLLRVTFDDADLLEAGDLVEITFWQNQIFARDTDGATVHHQSRFVFPIVQQVDPDVSYSLETLAQWLIILALVVAAMIIFTAIYLGSVTTLWMFLNSLQLIVYTALLNVSLPADSRLFMTSLLDALRLNFGAPETSNEVEGSIFEHTVKESTFNASILRLGYSARLFPNLASIGSIIDGIFAIWALALVYQVIQEACCKKINFSFLLPQLVNAFTRLLYVFWLEIWICCLLSLASFESIQDFSIAMVITWLLLVLLCFYCILFFKSGPYLKKVQSYEGRTLLNFVCCWQVRKVTADVEKLTQEKIERELEKLQQKEKEEEAENASIEMLEQGTRDSIDRQGDEYGTNRGLLCDKD